jgi:hypothetical protein
MSVATTDLQLWRVILKLLNKQWLTVGGHPAWKLGMGMG